MKRPHVIFEEPDVAITEAQITRCEAKCGLRLPPSLRNTYLRTNGGVPAPYVFENDDLDTVVSKFLPLISKTEETKSAVECYEHLVRELALVPPNFFPFAVDGGGDYFFVDTASPGGMVFFYRSDTTFGHLFPLGLTVDEFWAALKPE